MQGPVDRGSFTLANDPPRKRRPPSQPREKKETKEERRRIAQISFEPPLASPEETIFRHSNWQTKRAKVRAALERAGTGAISLERFKQCGAQAMVYQHEETGQFRVAAEYCKNRHCEPCQRAKANLLASNLREKLLKERGHQFRFVTLTLKHSDAPLPDQIKRLYDSFGKLRKTKLWKKSQEGGCAILEVKWKPETRQWHPHLHVICDGRFLAQHLLSETWEAITGDSKIVDIRQLKSEQDAAHYVAKYVSKGTNDDVWADEAAAIEWCVSMKGVRTCATFGTWRGFKLLAHPPKDEGWQPLISLDRLWSEARAGSVHARNVLAQVLDQCKYDPHKKRRLKPDTPPVYLQIA